MQEIEEKLVKGEKIPGILKVNDASVLPDIWSEAKLTSVVRPWIKKTDGGNDMFAEEEKKVEPM